MLEQTPIDEQSQEWIDGYDACGWDCLILGIGFGFVGGFVVAVVLAFAVLRG